MITYGLLKLFAISRVANNYHHQGQALASHLQNIGINLFANTFVFDGDENFPAMINRELWLKITRVMDFVDRVQEFINNISIDLDNITLEFMQCDRDLEVRAEREINAEVSRAELCLGQGGGKN